MYIKIFLDTANIKEIKEIKSWGIISGLTTNQKIFSREKGINFEEHTKRILKMMEPYPVSIEGSNNYTKLVKEAKVYRSWGSNVVIKVPMLSDGSGLKAVRTLSNIGIKTNVTACMDLNQAFLTSLADATYVSLFYNRIIDYYKGIYKNESMARQEALEVIESTQRILVQEESKTKMIVGSIRSAKDIKDLLSLTYRPDIITIPPKILRQMCYHPKTEETLKEFDEAWENFLKGEKK